MKIKIIIIVLLIALFGICFHLTDLWCFLKENTTNGFDLFDVNKANRQKACHMVWYADYAIFVIMTTMLLTTLITANSSGQMIPNNKNGGIRDE